MDTFLLWANNNLGADLSETVVTLVIVMFFLMILYSQLIDPEVSLLAGRFSSEFRKTLSWVFVLFIISAFSQGTIADVKEAFSADFYGGIGFLIGSLIALFIFPILITYFIRLFFPLFKWIHNKTQ